MFLVCGLFCSWTYVFDMLITVWCNTWRYWTCFYQHRGQSFNNESFSLSVSPCFLGSSNRPFSSEDALWQITWPGVGANVGRHGQNTPIASGMCVVCVCVYVSPSGHSVNVSQIFTQYFVNFRSVLNASLCSEAAWWLFGLSAVLCVAGVFFCFFFYHDFIEMSCFLLLKTPGEQWEEELDRNKVKLSEAKSCRLRLQCFSVSLVLVRHIVCCFHIVMVCCYSKKINMCNK